MNQTHKKILEAINKGIQFALDDFEPEDIQASKSKQKTIHKDDSLYQNLLLRDYVVDLGLPSRTLWCKYNLGCDFEKLNNNSKQSKARDWYGDYYAWGEIESNKNEYSWKTYKYSVDSYNTLKKYCGIWQQGYNGYIDGLTQLLSEDDVAYQNMHLYNFKFCIPTYEQFKELIKYTNHRWVNHYYNTQFLNGIVFTGKNGNEIFLPAAGYYKESKFDTINLGHIGKYWTSDLTDKINNYYLAYYIGISTYTDDQHQNVYYGNCNRCYGLSIRPIIQNY